MRQSILLERERLWENMVWEDAFMIENSENPEQSFRNAIKEYLLTKEGLEAIKATSEDFNWGDGIVYVPESIWNKHGIYSLDEKVENTPVPWLILRVTQDEVLIPKEYYSIEEM